MNLEQSIGEYLKELQRQHKVHNTIRSYKNDLACFDQYWQKYAKKRELKEFSTSMVMEYGGYLEEKYPSSSNSRRRRLQALRLFFDFLVNKKLFGENPIRLVPVSPKKLNAPSPIPYGKVLKFSKNQQEKFQEGESALERLVALRNLVIIHLIYGCGLKVSQVADFPIKYLAGKYKRLLIQHPKRDPFSIPVPNSTQNLLKDYCSQLSLVKTAQGVSFDQLVFNANAYRIHRGGLSERGIELIFKNYSDKHKLSNFTPRLLRQACIFKWLVQGIPESTIKEWMGVMPNYSLKPFIEVLKEQEHLGGVYSELPYQVTL